MINWFHTCDDHCLNKGKDPTHNQFLGGLKNKSSVLSFEFILISDCVCFYAIQLRLVVNVNTLNKVGLTVSFCFKCLII